VQARVVVADRFEVGLENRVVCRIEPDQGGVEADVCFGDVASEEEGLMCGGREVAFETV
jgi:hypothetical protein